MSRRRRCTHGKPYAVELGAGVVYVGETSKSPASRFREHKAGGRTSSPIVRAKGKRLRKDLVGRSRTEAALARKLRRRGYDVPNKARPFCGPRAPRRRRA